MEFKYLDFYLCIAMLVLHNLPETDGCGSIPVVPNAELNDTNVSPPFANGVGIAYKCKDEFKATGGSSIAVCNGAVWEGPTLICEPIGCQNLPYVKNAHPEEVGDPPYNIAKRVTYTCEMGYLKQDGTNIAVCSLRNGKTQWEVPSLRCVPVDCGPPPDAPNARRLGNLHTFPNDVSYVCDEGYKMLGHRPNTTCLPSGTWSNRPPVCQIVSCPRPDNPSHGNIEIKELTYGSTIKFSCNESFKLKGTQELECLSSGVWSEPAPICDAVSCPPYARLPGGRIVIGANKTSVGSLMILKCDDPEDSSTVKCVDTGEWYPPIPYCQGAFTTTEPTKQVTVKPTTGSTNPTEPRNGSLCSHPGAIDHGHIEGDVKFPTYSSIRYICDEGYTIKGTTSFNCLDDGTWDPNILPKCHKRSWLEIIIGVVVGVVVVAVICAGAVLYYVKKRKGRRPSDSPLNPGNRNKAKVLDAKTQEEVRYLERDRKVIPVTSL